jgi:hypothetical protein
MFWRAAPDLVPPLVPPSQASTTMSYCWSLKGVVPQVGGVGEVGVAVEVGRELAAAAVAAEQVDAAGAAVEGGELAVLEADLAEEALERSAPPVARAIFGMLPSALLLRQARQVGGDLTFSTQGATFGMDDRAAPLADRDDEGDLRAGRDVGLRMNSPLVSVRSATRGSPERAFMQLSQ